MVVTNETMEDYLARLNLEGARDVWIRNRGRINYVYKKTKKYIKNATTACEVGVGEGYLLRLLYSHGLKVVGIDISKYLVNKLRNEFKKERLDIELIRGDFSKVNLGKDKFDLFFCLNVLEHIPNLRKAIENLTMSLSNGGLLIGALPLHENLDNGMVVCPKCHHKFHRIGHYHTFDSIKEIKQLLGMEFKIIHIGEVKSFTKVSDILYYIIKSIRKYIFRIKTTPTVYFVAKLCKR